MSEVWFPEPVVTDGRKQLRCTHCAMLIADVDHDGHLLKFLAGRWKRDGEGRWVCAGPVPAGHHRRILGGCIVEDAPGSLIHDD